LMDRCLERGLVPSMWSLGIITPLLKPDKPVDELKSQRPVTLTCHLGKVMERIVLERIIYWIHDKLHPAQYGFMRGRSTLDALIEHYEYIFEAWNTETTRTVKRKNGQNRNYDVRYRVLSVLIDFTSAFDTLSHAAIIEACEALGIGKFELRWIRNWLADRRNCVRLNNTTSKWKHFTAGVPQGTVLGPLLFIICMDSLLKKLNLIPELNAIAFADDLTVDARGGHIDDCIVSAQKALNTLKQWTKWSKMRVNITKTKAILHVYTTSRSPQNRTKLKLTYDEREIKIQLKCNDKERLLGVYEDPAMKFKMHLDVVKDKCDTRLNLVKKLASSINGINSSMIKALYEGFQENILLYGAEAWFPQLSKTNRLKLEGIQRNGVRSIRGLPNKTDPDSVYLETGTLPLSVKVNGRLAKLAVRYLTGSVKQKEMLEGAATMIIGKSIWKSPLMNAKEQLEKYIDKDEIARLRIVCKRIVTIIEPWDTSFQNKVEIHPLVSMTPKKKLKEHEQKKISDDAINSRGYHDVVVATDGAKDKDKGTSGAGGVLYRHGKLLIKIRRNTGKYATIFTAEAIAIRDSLKHLTTCLKDMIGETVLIISDSHSVLENLTEGFMNAANAIIQEIWFIIKQLLNGGVKKITFQHVFSHCGVSLNHEADYEAGEGSKVEVQNGEKIEVTFEDLTTYFKSKSKENYKVSVVATKSNYRAIHFGTSTYDKEESHLKRREQVLLSQIRCDACSQFGTMHRIFNPTVALSCRCCCREEHKSDDQETQTTGPLSSSKEKMACPYCQCKPLANKNKLERHIKILHNEEHQRWRKENVKEKPKGNNSCPFCIKRYTSRVKLHNHVKDAHGDKYEKWRSKGEKEVFQCDKAECLLRKPFKSKSGLTQHLKKIHNIGVPVDDRPKRKESRGVMETWEHLINCTELRKYWNPAPSGSLTVAEPFRSIERLLEFLANTGIT